jgi:5S rRNA maturation endonuclease (ribonuclease M5)
MNKPRTTTREELIAELEAAGATVQGNKIKCPWHDDQHASAGVYQGDDGVWRFKCQACGVGGSYYDMKAKRTGESLSVIIKQDSGNNQSQKKKLKAFDSLESIYGILSKDHGGQLEALHHYTEKDGTLVQYVIRWRGSDRRKYIWPVIKTNEGFELRGADKRVLYRLQHLNGNPIVVVVEGELKADMLSEYGIPVTTSLGGSNAAGKTSWKALEGKKVIIWPDNDKAGTTYANEVRKTLEGLNCKVKTIDPSRLDLQEGEDAADFIKQLKVVGYDSPKIKSELWDVLKNATSTGPGSELQNLFSAIGAGLCEPIETGFQILDDIMQILPGSLTIVAGSPGSSKSLLMLQIASRLFDNQIKTAIFELEKDRVFHLRRALAQRSGLGMITNNRWTKKNIVEAQEASVEYLEFMDSFGKTIYATPEKIIYQSDVIEWVQQKADDGCKAVIIDPVTKAERKGDPWQSDSEFVQQLAKIATMSGLVIFIVLHPTKAQVAIPDLSLIAGGAAYSRFADNAIWLDSHEPKYSRIHYSTGTQDDQHNRTLWILKSRDGSGTNSRIAYDFIGDNLTMRELGRIERKQK